MVGALRIGVHKPQIEQRHLTFHAAFTALQHLAIFRQKPGIVATLHDLLRWECSTWFVGGGRRGSTASQPQDATQHDTQGVAMGHPTPHTSLRSALWLGLPAQRASRYA